MTRYIDRNTVYGNALLARFDSAGVGGAIYLADILNDSELLIAELAKSDVFVRHTTDDTFSEDYRYIVEEMKDPKQEVSWKIKKSKESIKRHFYDGLPPVIAKVFEDFYKREDVKIPAWANYSI